MLTAVAFHQRYSIALLLLLSTFCHGSERGRVNMTGNIFESSCTVDDASAVQLILMKNTSIAQILRDGKGEYSSLNVHLIGCSNQSANRRFRVTFHGIKGSHDAFQLAGSSRGIEMHLRDSQGERIKPDEPMFINQETIEANTLNFTLILTGNGETLQPGLYATVLRMKLDYF